jgi:hypothetical protein
MKPVAYRVSMSEKEGQESDKHSRLYVKQHDVLLAITALKEDFLTDLVPLSVRKSEMHNCNFQ